MHGGDLREIKALQHPGRPFHPPGQRLAIDGDALAGQDQRLTIQRRAPGVFRRGNPGDERGRDHSAFDQTWRRGGLNDCFFTTATGVFRPDRAQYAQHRRNPVQGFADGLADAVKAPGATRAHRRPGLDRLLDTRQMLRQSADIALRLAADFPRLGGLNGGAVVIGGSRHGGVRLIAIQSQR